MKTIGRERAFQQLRDLKTEFRSELKSFEANAESCGTCDTPGACCLDAHFVNVRITRIEAEAIARELSALSTIKRAAVEARIDDSIERFGLRDGTGNTYACPLYERNSGCLVHDARVKPLPCMHHACYEKREDLPPDSLLENAELQAAVIDRRTYGKPTVLTPLPLAVRAAMKRY